MIGHGWYALVGLDLLIELVLGCCSLSLHLNFYTAQLSYKELGPNEITYGILDLGILTLILGHHDLGLVLVHDQFRPCLLEMLYLLLLLSIVTLLHLLQLTVVLKIIKILLIEYLLLEDLVFLIKIKPNTLLQRVRLIEDGRLDRSLTFNLSNLIF